MPDKTNEPDDEREPVPGEADTAAAPEVDAEPLEPAAAVAPAPEPEPEAEPEPEPEAEPEVEPEAEPDAKPAPLAPAAPRGRRAGVAVAQAAGAVVAIAIAAATVVAATMMPSPLVTATAPSTLVTPASNGQQLVCPGSLLRLSDDAGQAATTASSLGLPSLSSGALPGRVEIAPFPTSQAGTGGSGGAPQLLSTPPAEPGASAGLIAAAQSQTVGGEFAGLATAACIDGSSESWLVGGSIAVGRTTLLTLSNPTEVAAVVNLALFGEDGAVETPGLTGISVEPHSQKVLSLAGFAPGLESPVVQVTSRGGRIVASLQQSIVRGIDPGGIDIVGASDGPRELTVIPGVVVSGSEFVGQRLGELGYGDLETVVRIYVPGDEEATTVVRLIPENDAGPAVSFDVEVPAGRVTELPIDELGDGNYTVMIQADVPLVAAVRVSTAAPGAGSAAGTTDFAWMSSAGELGSEALLSVASGVEPVLHLANAGTADAGVVLQPLTGPEVFLTVPAGASIAVAVLSGTSYRISGFDTLYASVTAAAQGGISGYAVPPQAAAASDLLIYP